MFKAVSLHCLFFRADAKCRKIKGTMKLLKNCSNEIKWNRAGESTLPTDDLATTTLLYYYILLHVKNKLFIYFFILKYVYIFTI